MESVLHNIVPQASNLDNEENLASNSDRMKVPVVGAGSTDFAGSQEHDVDNQAGGDRMVSLALTASQKTSDEVEGVNQASTAQIRLLWRLCTVVYFAKKLAKMQFFNLLENLFFVIYFCPTYGNKTIITHNFFSNRFFISIGDCVIYQYLIFCINIKFFYIFY